MRKLLTAVLVALLLAGIAAVLWHVLDWPPPRLILAYGLPPTGGPTGRTMTVGGIEFVELSPGYFRMGSHHHCDPGDLLGRVCAPLGLPWGRKPTHDGECPLRWVEIGYRLWAARTEVTNAAFERFEPGRDRDPVSRDDRHPAVYVSWDRAREFCAWLSERSGGPRIRLPSEAEWEFACRAGSSGDFCHGDDIDLLGEVTNFADGGAPVRGAEIVGSRRPNAWGLNDLHGNVWEWCEDADHWDYRGAPLDGSARTAEGLPEARAGLRIKRGGFWSSAAESCRSATRSVFAKFVVQPHLGFRPVLTLPTTD